jgi:hypothetical protein
VDDRVVSGEMFLRQLLELSPWPGRAIGLHGLVKIQVDTVDGPPGVNGLLLEDGSQESSNTSYEDRHEGPFPADARRVCWPIGR